MLYVITLKYAKKLSKNLLTCSLGAGLQCDYNKEIAVFPSVTAGQSRDAVKLSVNSNK